MRKRSSLGESPDATINSGVVEQELEQPCATLTLNEGLSKVIAGHECWSYTVALSEAHRSLRLSDCLERNFHFSKFVRVECANHKITLWIPHAFDPRLVAYLLDAVLMRPREKGSADHSGDYKFVYKQVSMQGGGLAFNLARDNYVPEGSQKPFLVVYDMLKARIKKALAKKGQPYPSVSLSSSRVRGLFGEHGASLSIEGSENMVAAFLRSVGVKWISVESEPQPDLESIILKDIKTYGLKVPAWYLSNPRPGVAFKHLVCCEDVAGRSPSDFAPMQSGRTRTGSATGFEGSQAKRLRVAPAHESMTEELGESMAMLTYAGAVASGHSGFTPYVFRGSCKFKTLSNIIYNKFDTKDFIKATRRGEEILIWIRATVDARLFAYLLFVFWKRFERIVLPNGSSYYFAYDKTFDKDGELQVSLNQDNYVTQVAQLPFSVVNRTLSGRIQKFSENSKLIDASVQINLGKTSEGIFIKGPREKVNKLLDAIYVKHTELTREVDPNAIILRELKAYKLDAPDWYTEDPKVGVIFERLPCSENVAQQSRAFEPAAVSASAVMEGIERPTMDQSGNEDDEDEDGETAPILRANSQHVPVMTTTTDTGNLTVGQSDLSSLLGQELYDDLMRMKPSNNGALLKGGELRREIERDTQDQPPPSKAPVSQAALFQSMSPENTEKNASADSIQAETCFRQ